MARSIFFHVYLVSMKKNDFFLGFLGLSMLFYSCQGSGESGQQTDPFADAPTREISAGQQLFVQNCLQCHYVEKDKIGPKLRGFMAHWNHDTARVRAFIRNSMEVIKSGDPRAVEVYEQYNKSVMTPMPHLSDEQIDQIIEYIEGPSH